MAALDFRSQPVDRTAAVRASNITNRLDEEDLKRSIAAEALARSRADEVRRQAEEERQKAQEGRVTQEQGTKAQLPIAATDIIQWQGDPNYQKPFHQLPEEARQHFIDSRTYAPEVSATIPEQWNRSLADTTGKIPGLDGMDPVGASVNPKGEATIQFKPTVPPDATGELTDNQRTLAEAIARYDIPPTQALGRFSQADREKIMSFAANMGYDAKEYPVRQASRRDFTSGMAARSITSLNTLIHHFDQVMESQKKLKNTSMPWVNKPWNEVKKGLLGDANLTKFETNANAVAEEMAKLLKGGVATKGEIEEWKSKLDPSLNDEQLRGNITEMMNLVAGRVDGLRNQWQSAYAEPRKLPFVDATSQEILRKHGFDPHVIDPGTGEASSPAGPADKPAAPSAPAPSKPKYVRQNGHTYTLQENGEYK